MLSGIVNVSADNRADIYCIYIYLCIYISICFIACLIPGAAAETQNGKASQRDDSGKWRVDVVVIIQISSGALTHTSPPIRVQACVHIDTHTFHHKSSTLFREINFNPS